MYTQDNNSLPVWSYNLSPAYLLISPPILNHFWWELYQGVLCMHNTTTTASLDYCHKLTNPYLHEFSSISGGNCIKEPPLNSFSISKNNSGFLIALFQWMNNSLTPTGLHFGRELWKVFLTSEESGTLMV